MRPPSTSSSNAFSSRCYRVALRLYPAAHRARFGLEMEQVFQQQWRQVREQHSVVAALAFSFRITSDVLLTSSHEQLNSLISNFRLKRVLSPSARLVWSLGAGVPVALLILSATIAVTLYLPSTFESSAKILVRQQITDRHRASAEHRFQVREEVEAIVSDKNLISVVEALSLGTRYSAEHRGKGTPLEPAEIISILRNRISIRYKPLTPILELRVQDHDSLLAAEIANALATNYVATRHNPPLDVPGVNEAISGPFVASVIQNAIPSRKPMHPNIFFNTFLGGVIGTGLGLVTSLIVWLILRRAAKRKDDASSHGRAMPA